MGSNNFPHVVDSPSTSAEHTFHYHPHSRPPRQTANVAGWSWGGLFQLGMLLLLLLAVLFVISLVFVILLRKLGRCLKRRRRKVLARTFNRSPEAESTAPLFQFSPRMSTGQFNFGGSLGGSFRGGTKRFPTIHVVEYPVHYGAVPQIQIQPSDIEDGNNLSAYRPLSIFALVLALALVSALALDSALASALALVLVLVLVIGLTLILVLASGLGA
ncbi:unnamed protein product [Bursaphelenchus okinawaensis]|uniref:Uncharacterized protein n=1 Tax=Bursaphelenchus okinawaensis TaxID=465554 RepID=A0A811L922_9BILA|nr:unnamed protein product [Bursaphelenchus okinawaensis]CAG9121312.1 unnamed protein product [Bursaphelenchus okinawaensis]